ncbi:MAG: hypothetical protein ACFHWZ_18675 [Phycisphaerales bacterium]
MSASATASGRGYEDGWSRASSARKGLIGVKTVTPPGPAGEPAQGEVDGEGDADVADDGGVKGEDGATPGQPVDRQRDRDRPDQQSRGGGHEVTHQHGSSRNATEVLGDREERERAREQGEDEEQATEEVAQHDLGGAERGGQQDVPVLRVAFLRDRPGHEDGSEDADKAQLKIGNPLEGRGAGCREVAIVLDRGVGLHQQGEEQDDEDAEVGRADVEVAKPARAAVDQSDADRVQRKQGEKPAAEVRHGRHAIPGGACGHLHGAGRRVGTPIRPGICYDLEVSLRKSRLAKEIQSDL